MHRARIAEAIGDGSREEIKAAIAERGSKPRRKNEFAPKSEYVQAINVNYGTNTVRIVLDASEINHPDVKPHSWISYTATMESGAIKGWKCAAQGVPAKLLPAACR